jgi:hypothetical protein
MILRRPFKEHRTLYTANRNHITYVHREFIDELAMEPQCQND